MNGSAVRREGADLAQESFVRSGPPPATRRQLLPRLRREVAALEGRPAPADAEATAGTDSDPASRQFPDRPSSFGWSRPRQGNGVLPLGIPALDAALGSGLPRAGLHEVRAEATRETGVQTGFAAALLALLADRDPRPALWVEEETALAEAGMPYGPGLARFGLDPGRLILIAARRPEEALWAMEEGLRCRGLAAVLAVIRGHPRALDFTALRRLALRARSHGVMGLLLRQAGTAEAGPSLTRWRVLPRPGGVMDGFAGGVGRPAFRLDLEKNRLGATGSFDVEWNHEERCFAPGGAEARLPGTARAGAADPPQPGTAVPGARPSLPQDRPAPPAGAGARVALFRTAG